ncbi:MAG: tail fiber domain-containing protein [Thermoanaerobaculia bacterium]
MHRLSFALALLLALVATAPGHAIPRATGGAESPPIAKVEISPSRIDWTPVLSEGYERVVLTVVGPEGFVLEKRFPRGTPPAFELGEVRDRTLPDGAYSYELRTMGKGAGQVQSGFFSVRGGSLFVPAAGVPGVEPPTAGRKPSGPPLQPKSITSGECVGEDCVSGDEGTPLRLKSASALRLDFTDGPSAITANHSWAIQANDLYFGGGTYLAVKDVDNSTTPFTITANAPDNALFVSSSGNVGLGTASPTVKLDAKVTSPGNVVAQMQNLSSTGYSGINYLNSDGLTVAFFGVDNAAATTRLNSLQGYPVVLLTRSVERMRITADGDVGIGTSSPADKFHLVCSGAGATCGKVTNSSATGYSGFEFTTSAGTAVANISHDNSAGTFRFNAISNEPIVIMTNSTERIRFPAPGGNVITAANGAFLSSGGTWTNSSSREVKQDITDLGSSEALQAFEHLNPVKFRYKAEPNQQYVGFIAEDVPDLVARNDRKSLSPMDVVAVLTKVVQEQQKTIEKLSARLTELEQAKK